MRRQWYLDTSVKSQAEVLYPELFFLRPALDEEKFPSERPIQLPAEVAARVRAQEAAGRLVFEDEPSAAPVTLVKEQPRLAPAPASERVELQPNFPEAAAGAYAHREQSVPTTLR
jgi:hypothetical protein